MHTSRPHAVRALAAGALSGVLLAVGSAPLGLGPLCFIGLVPLLALLDMEVSLAAGAAAGGLAGLLFFGSALAWVPAAGVRGETLALLFGYLLALASSWALFGAGLSWLRARQRAAFFLAAPGLWIALELARAQGPFGYPWHHLGYALSDFPVLVQLAACGGVYAVSLWVVAANAALVAAGRGIAWARPLACLVLLGPLCLGIRLVHADGVETVSIAAIQPGEAAPAAGSRQRFDARLRELLELTDRAIAAEPPDLVVWPESAYEATILPGGDPFLGSLALHYERPLLLGARRLEPGSPPRLFNSAVLARADGSTRIAGDKVHPVPIYEARPDSRLARLLERRGLWPGRFESGERAGIVRVAAAKLGILICFDSSFPSLARDLRRRGAQLLVELSNEAQTGIWTARQHARVSRLRAIETGLPLLRVGNIGPTEWVDAYGRVRARIAAGEVGFKTASLALPETAPPYVRFGSAPAFIAGLVPLLPLMLWPRRSPKTRSRSSA